jgi:hypothetical protein
MPGGVYLIQEGGELVETSEQLYDSEDLLQEAIRDPAYPSSTTTSGSRVRGSEELIRASEAGSGRGYAGWRMRSSENTPSRQ